MTDILTGDEAVQAYHTAKARGGGLQLGWDLFDLRSGGLFPGSLTVIGAESNVGKTFACLSLQAQLAKAGKTSLLIESEDGIVELGKRLSTISPQLRGRVHVACSSPEIGDVVRLLEDASQRGYAAVFVDYLQDLIAEGSLQKHDEVRVNLARIKNASHAFPVIVCSQLTDKFEADDRSAEPDVRQLRYSKDIRIKATHVILLWQDHEDRAVVHARHAKNKTGRAGGRWLLRRGSEGMLEPEDDLFDDT